MGKYIFYIFLTFTTISNENCQTQLSDLNINSGDWIEINVLDSNHDLCDGYMTGTINDKGFVKLFYRIDPSKVECDIINILFDCKVSFWNRFISKAAIETEKKEVNNILKKDL